MAHTPSIDPKEIPTRVQKRLGDLKASVEHAESEVEAAASKAGANLRKATEKTQTAVAAANARAKTGLGSRSAEEPVSPYRARNAMERASKSSEA